MSEVQRRKGGKQARPEALTVSEIRRVWAQVQWQKINAKNIYQRIPQIFDWRTQIFLGTRQRKTKLSEIEKRLIEYVEARARRYQTDKCGISFSMLQHKF